jgi:hypothetical protein
MQVLSSSSFRTLKDVSQLGEWQIRRNLDKSTYFSSILCYGSHMSCLPPFLFRRHHRCTAMENRPHSSTLDPAIHSIRIWLEARMPELARRAATAHLTMIVGEDGRITGLEISSPDPVATRLLQRLLRGAQIPHDFQIGPGKHEMGPWPAVIDA